MLRANACGPYARNSGHRGPAMNRFVHRIIMVLLLAAALAVIWNVLGSR
jgi:hypothetical protein